MTRPDEILDLVTLVSLAALCVIALRRLVQMDGLLVPRVLLLSVLLWLPVCYLFLSALPPFDNVCFVAFDEVPDAAP